jgi:Amt family ammonium transporter
MMLVFFSVATILLTASAAASPPEMMNGDCDIDDLKKSVLDMSAQIAEIEFELQNRALLASNVTESTFSSGNTAWMLVSTSRVLAMTLPGVAIYYGGLIRSKDLITTMMHIFSIACLITMVWMCFGYSIAFSPASADNFSTEVYGDGDRLFLRGIKLNSFHQMAPTIPESIFCAYELSFAIITASFISGSFAGRMRYLPMLAFMALWLLVVYCPIAHSVWHPDGFLHKVHIQDSAGGLVVHVSSGMSGLASCLILGTRKGLGTDRYSANNILYTFTGLAFCWVGWFSFNGGSGYNATDLSGNALLMTQISAAMGSISWLIVMALNGDKPSILGAISGANAGLICITPGCTFVDHTAAFMIGLIGSALCFYGCRLKTILNFDDALDNFGLHAVGGTFGILATAFFSRDSISGEENHQGVFYTNEHDGRHIFSMQLYGVVVVMGWAFAASYALLFIIDRIVGLRVSAIEEEVGLDKAWSMASFSERFID